MPYLIQFEPGEAMPGMCAQKEKIDDEFSRRHDQIATNLK
jgi:hypothetical protein